MINKNSTKEEEQGDRDVLMAEIKRGLKSLLSMLGSSIERMEQEVKND
jgi:hypothetical protein